MKSVTTVLDLESILIPEIWIAIAKHFGVKELMLTTREVPDFDKLTKHRIDILRENNIKLSDMEEVLNKIEPLPGAVEFISWLKERTNVVVISGSFVQFVEPVLENLGKPTIYCHTLIIDKNGFATGYEPREKGDKKNYIKDIKQKSTRTIAVGDSFNDTGMLSEADVGILFNSSGEVRKAYPQFKHFTNYGNLEDFILEKL